MRPSRFRLKIILTITAFILVLCATWTVALLLSRAGLEQAKAAFDESYPPISRPEAIERIEDAQSAAEKAYFEWFSTAYARFELRDPARETLNHLFTGLYKAPLDEWNESNIQELNRFLNRHEDLLARMEEIDESFPIAEHKETIERILGASMKK